MHATFWVLYTGWNPPFSNAECFERGVCEKEGDVESRISLFINFENVERQN